jgi:glycosyltransferase involved in cell wall biosynthesis
MNIWFAANIASESNGGVARSMQGFAEGLRALGHQTTIVVNAPQKISGFLAFTAALASRLFRERKNPPDWIVARSTDGVGCSLVAKALGLKTRIALHNHGWEETVYEIEQRLPRWFVYPATTWKARLIRFPLLRMCLVRSAACLCGTLSEIRWLKKKYPGCRDQLCYVPNGVRMPVQGFWMERDNFQLNFLAVGSLTWKKNLDHVIAVFEEFSRHRQQCRLFLVGTGLGEKNFPHALSGKTTIVPSVRPHEMTRWYTTCPYFISASRYEGGHSFALLEAMAQGCVVFVSAIPSSMEIVKNRHNGMLITGVDIFDDANIISTALKEQSLLAAMRRHAFSTALRQRWERQVHRLERVLCRS